MRAATISVKVPGSINIRAVMKMITRSNMDSGLFKKPIVAAERQRIPKKAVTQFWIIRGMSP